MSAENGTSTKIKDVFKGSNRTLAAALVDAIMELENYWPLTVRQSYYQMVARLVVPNSQKQYRRVSTVLVKLREHGFVPWRAIEDRTRRTTKKRGHTDAAAWLQEQLESFANPRFYGRCYVQHQQVYAEVATEKDALASILEDTIHPYCTRLSVMRGQGSATIVEQLARRFDAAVMRGQHPVLLYFGDLDPSGVAIPRSIKNTLLERHGVDVEVRRVALLPEQVQAYNLPQDPEAAKEADPNYKAWLRDFGPHQAAVELDALHPRDLQDLLVRAVESVYDMTTFAEQRRQEMLERVVIRRIRADVLDFLTARYPEYFVEQ